MSPALKSALLCLVVAKVSMIAGMALATNRALGGSLLGLSGVLILCAVALCLRESRRQHAQTEDDKERLLRMMQEGTLKQYLRDVGYGRSEQQVLQAERDEERDAEHRLVGSLVIHHQEG